MTNQQGAPEAPKSTALDGKTELFHVSGYPLLVRAVDFNRLYAENAALQQGYNAARLEIDHLRGATKSTLLAQPVAWLVYLPSIDTQHLYYSQEDMGYVDDVTNHADAEVTPLYEMAVPKAEVTPSDAEIDAQWRESVEKHETTAAFVRDFARAVIAKWGTPPQISESDTDYWVRNRALILQAIEDRGFRLVSSGGLFWLHGPSLQAQAGAAPLTDEQVARIARSVLEAPAADGVAPAWELAVGIARAIEAAHGIGIKGGQHGAE